MVSKTDVKHPDAVKKITFDFTQALADIGDTGISATMRADSGIALAMTGTSPIFRVAVAGGANGSQYNYGVELITSSGSIIVDMRRMRVQGVSAPSVLDGGDPMGSGDIPLDGGGP